MVESKSDHLNGTSAHPVVVTSVEPGLMGSFGVQRASKSHRAALLIESIGHTSIPLVVFDQEGDYPSLLLSSGRAADEATKQPSTEVQG